MGTLTICSKFERVGTLRDAADSGKNLIIQGGRGNSEF